MRLYLSASVFLPAPAVFFLGRVLYLLVCISKIFLSRFLCMIFFETSTMEKFLIYNIYKLSMKSNALWRFWTFGKIPFPASAHA